MRKFCIVLTAVLLFGLLTGCGLIETDNPPTLPKLDLDSSKLTCTVEYVNGRTCRISVLADDGHYRAATEKRSADVLFVTFTSLEGKKSVQVGDTVTFTYSYTTDVTERDGKPHITVRTIHVD